MRAHHDQLVALARAGQLGDHVVGLLVAIRGGDGGVEAHLRRHVLLGQAGETVVVLGRHHDRGRRPGLGRLPRLVLSANTSAAPRRDRRSTARQSTPSLRRRSRHSSSVRRAAGAVGEVHQHLAEGRFTLERRASWDRAGTDRGATSRARAGCDRGRAPDPRAACRCSEAPPPRAAGPGRGVDRGARSARGACPLLVLGVGADPRRELVEIEGVVAVLAVGEERGRGEGPGSPRRSCRGTTPWTRP